MWRRSQNRAESGFTLIELLIVVAIIAILAAVLIPNFMRARGQARVSASKSHLRGIGNALESYFIDNGEYPATGTAAMKAALQGPPTYVQAVPRDPCTGGDYVYTATGTPPGDYVLETPSLTGTSCEGLVPGDKIFYLPGSGISP